MKRGKKYVEAAKAVDRATLYDTAEAKTGYPRVSRGSFFIRLRIFSVLLCTFFIYSFSFFQNIDRRIHIPVHPVSTFA